MTPQELREAKFKVRKAISNARGAIKLSQIFLKDDNQTVLILEAEKVRQHFEKMAVDIYQTLGIKARK